MKLNFKLTGLIPFSLGISFAFFSNCIPSLEKVPAHQLLILETLACLTENGCNSNSRSPTVVTPGTGTETGNQSPSGLSYSPASSSLVINIAITNLSPTVTGTVASYSITPTLPTGLAFNTTTGVISGTPTVLSASTNYTVTATNTFGSTTSILSIQVLNGKRIFVTAIGYKPGTSYISATTADTRCNSDADRPAGPNPYKAMLVDTNRIASITPNIGDGQLDWVFKPNMSYERPDGTAIGITNANSLLQFPLTNSIFTAAQYHTGLNADWTTLTFGNCSNWTDGTSMMTGSGVSGRAEFTTNAILNGAATISCGLSAGGQQLLCVEQ